MERLPIALLTRPVAGGMKKHILQLANGLNRERFSVHLLGPAELAGEIQGRDIKHFPVNLAEDFNPLTKAPQLWQVSRYLRQNRVRLLHCHGVQAAFLGRLAAWLAGTPAVVCTFHNLVYDRPYHPWRKRMYALANGFLNRKASCVITVSQALKEQLMAQEGVPAEKIRIIYNGLDEDLLGDAAGEEEPARTGQPVIGLVGRLVPEKGADLFLAAVPLILEKHPETQVWIIGDGPCSVSLQRQARQLGVEEKVTFWGYVDNPLPLLKAMDLVVVPSRSEGLSIVTLEAMALAKPVVAFRAGALPEVVQPEVTGLLVSPYDVPALAGAVNRLLGNSDLRAALGRNGQLRVRQHFSAGRMIQETETVYELALAGARAFLEDWSWQPSD